MNSAAMPPEKLAKLEKRARDACSGYGSDVNITCYVYGQDVMELIQEIKRARELEGKLRAELQSCLTDNGRNGEEHLVEYAGLSPAAVKRCCNLLGLKG